MTRAELSVSEYERSSGLMGLGADGYAPPEKVDRGSAQVEAVAVGIAGC
jgi:hypothetical protein